MLFVSLVMKMLLNADLGEGEPEDRTAELMRVIDLANIACGGHAGNAETMERAVRLAIEHGVKIGAHPGLVDGFGRGAAKISPAGLERLIVEQVGALMEIACGDVRHIKLHGALYHAVETSAELARCYVEVVQRNFPQCAIVTLAGGCVAARCERAGANFLPEAFADRGYLDNGSLVPRGEPGAVIESPSLVAERLRSLLEDGEIESVSGHAVPMNARTVCVHSDTPNAVRIARAARSVLGPRV